MNKKQESKDIETIAEAAEQGKDVSEHFTNQYSVKQRINIDFPLDLLQVIDVECKRVGVSRQAWIKMACDERLRQIKVSLKESAWVA
ncbi:MAG: CopG family transcriptional regulator [SAR324 cluster bacterium]|nr:CopG family transcriptional regulator [SAR324 cluster bacterium]